MNPRSLALSAAAAVVATAAVAGPAAAAPGSLAVAPTRPHISDVTVDCVGDVVRGEVQVRRGPGGELFTITVAWQYKGGAFVSGPTQNVTTSRRRNSYPYTFDVSGHMDSYRLRVTATGQNSHRTTIRTDTCAPGTEVPEASVAAALPVGMIATGLAVVLVRRRRTAAALRAASVPTAPVA